MSENVVQVTPLINFDSDVELLKLGEKLCLRRARDEEMHKLLNKITRDESPYLPLLAAKFVLEDKIEPPSTERMRNTILALRLLKAGDLRIVATFQLRRTHAALGSWGTLHTPHFLGKTYILGKEEITTFIELWKKVQEASSRTHLQFALRKFMEAYDVWYDERIVEYTTAFESFVFYGRDKTIPPAGEVVGIVVGMAIGNSQKERRKIKKTLMNAHKFRNAWVHGNVKKLKSWNLDLRQLSTEVEEYLRRALRKLVEE